MREVSEIVANDVQETTVDASTALRSALSGGVPPELGGQIAPTNLMLNAAQFGASHAAVSDRSELASILQLAGAIRGDTVELMLAAPIDGGIGPDSLQKIKFSA